MSSEYYPPEEGYVEEQYYQRPAITIDTQTLQYLEEDYQTPPTIKDKFWALLNKNLALGNFQPIDEEILMHTIEITAELVVASIPPRKFSFGMWRDLEQAKAAAFIAMTRARFGLERKLLATQITVREVAGSSHGTKPSILARIGSLFGRG